MPQSAPAALLVRPAAFGYNAETAASNRFQLHPAGQAGEAGAIVVRARAEFDGLVRALRSEGIGLCVVEDTAAPAKPDAVFPNNWLSWHADGTVVLYPMLAVSRRAERRAEIIDAVVAKLPFKCNRVLDLSVHEREGRFLEGTGSLVLDHAHRVAYACRSARTDEGLVREWAQLMHYRPVIFDAADECGAALYHTNVMLCVGVHFTVVCPAAIDARDRDRVLDELRATGRELIAIDLPALRHFAGNMLELAAWDEALGDYGVLVMSATARAALAHEQFAKLSACADSILAVPVPTIEAQGGGSVRCMLAEVPELAP
ncbi:MAG: citrulline utilization hydrolase CtlX [Steroidobacterales bacterium]